MEIKTLTEARADRVLVRVQEAEGLTDPRIQVVVTLPGATYDAGAAADVLAENYQRARAELGAAQVNEEYHLAQIAKLEAQVREYNLDRHTERDRADRAELELRELRADVRRQAEELNKRFTFQQVEDAKANARASEGARIRSQIRGLVNTKRVDDALRRPDPEADRDFIGSPMGSWSALSALIGEIRELLDNPA